MNEYEVNCRTLALIANNKKTKVYEDNRIIYINKTPNEIMEASCQYFGSSLTGRQKGTLRLIGVSYKPPVIVEESNSIIFFPTGSPRADDCSWIGLRNIDRYYSYKDKIIVEFKNKQKIELNLSMGVLDNQIMRATRLESVLRGRKTTKILEENVNM